MNCMRTHRCDAEIKIRVPASLKLAIEKVARRRFLAAADIQREAFREYLERQGEAGQKDAKSARRIAA